MKLLVKNSESNNILELIFSIKDADFNTDEKLIYLNNEDLDILEKIDDNKFYIWCDEHPVVVFTDKDIIKIEGTEKEKEFFKDFFGLQQKKQMLKIK